MTVAKIECFAGASGDMFLGAWFSLDVPQNVWHEQMRGLTIRDEFEVRIAAGKKQEITATCVTVYAPDSHHHRHLPDIDRIIEESELPSIVKLKSKEVFYQLAVAEASVHGTTPDRIHFHEVGAIDAIVDIVGNILAWHLLGEPECFVTPIEVGGGTVRCAHGLMPIPAPATAVLLQGYPTYSSGLWGETTTPTGAAMIRTLAKPMPRDPFISKKIGYGAGTKELLVANVLRIQLGEWAIPWEVNHKHDHEMVQE